MTALPLIVLLPVLSGAFLLHAHGAHEAHMHRMLQDELAQPADPLVSLSGHDHKHDDHRSSKDVEPEEPKEPDNDSVIVIIPSLGIAPLPSATFPCFTAEYQLAVFIAIEPASTFGQFDIAQVGERAPPKRSGAHAVLISSHALLV